MAAALLLSMLFVIPGSFDTTMTSRLAVYPAAAVLMLLAGRASVPRWGLALAGLVSLLSVTGTLLAPVPLQGIVPSVRYISFFLMLAGAAAFARRAGPGTVWRLIVASALLAAIIEIVVPGDMPWGNPNRPGPLLALGFVSAVAGRGFRGHLLRWGTAILIGAALFLTDFLIAWTAVGLAVLWLIFGRRRPLHPGLPIAVLAAGLILASNTTDLSPWPGTHGAAEADLTELDYIDLEALGTSNRCVGVGFDGTNFWVTDAQDSGGNLWIHIISGDASHSLITTVDQNGTSGWGLRDLCWDGTYMFGSQSTTVDYYDNSYTKVGSYTCSAVNPNRAQAWDGTYFYTGSFDATVYQVTWNGVSGSTASHTSWSTAVSNNGTYGAAWDMYNNCLWVSTASYDGMLYQLDASGSLITTYDISPESATSGGSTMGTYTGTGDDQLWVLAQAEPDGLYCWEVVTPLASDTWGSIKTLF